ncbi:hypothetical protein X753_21320 [Mesorhizobium sp. LNJC399B00]|uniref:hypothetical protein n=1 Tax=unclassified Mesorhizobium TaxID=325217 RepID=UPI0003CF7B32|nr:MULTISPECIES: hypothetical protein [unclassified Mesorhizobium]ESY03895.1 hypothetical protein X753_21320 [Mesorhizobium sp. LNJC399B00]WJI68866.1 hypothetical protein NLY36_29515 [Mesorhizobium sp. C399B]
MSDLSEGAKKILRHFRDNKIPQLAYEFPDTLAALFDDPEECEQAQKELQGRGFIELGPELPKHIPVSSRVRHAAITLEGERHTKKNDI